MSEAGLAQTLFLADYRADAYFEEGPVIRLSDGTFVLPWVVLDATTGDAIGIAVKRISASGTLIGPAVQIAATPLWTYPDSVTATALSDGGYLVSWLDQVDGGDETALFGQRFTASGTAMDGVTQLSQMELPENQQGSHFGLPLNGGGWISVWTASSSGPEILPGASGKDVYGRLYDAQGNAIGGDFFLSTTVAGDQYFAGFAQSSTTLATVLRSVGGAGQLRARLFDNDGMALQDDFALTVEPALGHFYREQDTIALADGSFVTFWEDVDNQTGWRATMSYTVFGREGVGHTATLGGDTPVSGSSLNAAALTSGGFVAVWCDGAAVAARVYAADGVTAGNILQVNGATSGTPGRSEVAALPDGGFVVTWSDDAAGGVLAQRFDGTGARVGGLITNASAEYGDFPVQITPLSGNGFATFWLSRPNSDRHHLAATFVTPNAAPDLRTPLKDATAQEGKAFRLTIPALTFGDSDGDVLTYTATQANGRALPSWLRFDAATRTFTGTPLPGTADLSIKVTATDGDGATVSDVFAVSTPRDGFLETILRYAAALAGKGRAVARLTGNALWEAGRKILTPLYNGGTKLLLNVSGAVGAAVGAKFTAYIDLADLFRVTAEGRGGYAGNRNGKVSIWVDGTGRLATLGGGVAFGITPISSTGPFSDPAGRIEDAASVLNMNLALGVFTGSGKVTRDGISRGVGLGPVTFDPADVLQGRFKPTLGVGGGGKKLVGGAQAEFSLLDITMNLTRFEMSRSALINGLLGAPLLAGPFGTLFYNKVVKPGLAGSPLVSQFTVSDGITGTGRNDTLVGTAAGEIIEAGKGADALVGQGGNDTLYGGGGRDTLRGGSGNDHLDGCVGNDVLMGGSGNDLYAAYLGEGSETINEAGGGGRDVLALVATPKVGAPLSGMTGYVFRLMPSKNPFDDINDLHFMRRGNDLVIKIQRQGTRKADGTVTIKNQGQATSAVETLQICSTDDVLHTISLTSAWDVLGRVRTGTYRSLTMSTLETRNGNMVYLT